VSSDLISNNLCRQWHRCLHLTSCLKHDISDVYYQGLESRKQLNGPLTYLLLISSFIFSAMSKSAGGLREGEGAAGGGGFGIDFLMASDLAFDGDIFAFMFE